MEPMTLLDFIIWNASQSRVSMVFLWIQNERRSQLRALKQLRRKKLELDWEVSKLKKEKQILETCPTQERPSDGVTQVGQKENLREALRRLRWDVWKLKKEKQKLPNEILGLYRQLYQSPRDVQRYYQRSNCTCDKKQEADIFPNEALSAARKMNDEKRSDRIIDDKKEEVNKLPYYGYPKTFCWFFAFLCADLSPIFYVTFFNFYLKDIIIFLLYSIYNNAESMGLPFFFCTTGMVMFPPLVLIMSWFSSRDLFLAWVVTDDEFAHPPSGKEETIQILEKERDSYGPTIVERPYLRLAILVKLIEKVRDNDGYNCGGTNLDDCHGDAEAMYLRLGSCKESSNPDEGSTHKDANDKLIGWPYKSVWPDGHYSFVFVTFLLLDVFLTYVGSHFGITVICAINLSFQKLHPIISSDLAHMFVFPVFMPILCCNWTGECLPDLTPRYSLFLNAVGAESFAFGQHVSYKEEEDGKFD